MAQLFAVLLALLSHLASVGKCPLAIGHGCLVGLLADVLDRQLGSSAGPSTLRSAIARRPGRRRGSPRHAARASPLRFSDPARIPGPRFPLLDHLGGGRLHSATQACGAAAGVLPGSRPVPRRSACQARGPGADPRSPSPRPPWRRSSSPRHGCAAGPLPGARLAPPQLRFPGPCGPGSHL